MTAVSSGPDISHGGVSGSEIWDNLFATMAYRSPGSAATSDRALERRRAASAVNNRIWEAWRWSGLVVFFLTPQWRRLRNIEIAWRLLRWWPRIDDQVRIMARQQRLSCRSATAPAGWGCFADSRLARYRLLPSGPCPPDIGVVGEYIVAIGARRPRRAGTSLRSRGADRDPGRYRLARPLPVADALSGRTEHQLTDPAASSSSKNGTFSGDLKDGQFLPLPAGRSRDRGLAYIDISTPPNFHCSSIVMAGRIRCSAELSLIR